jgi:hypothetical protein
VSLITSQAGLIETAVNSKLKSYDSAIGAAGSIIAQVRGQWH